MGVGKRWEWKNTGYWVREGKFPDKNTSKLETPWLGMQLCIRTWLGRGPESLAATPFRNYHALAGYTKSGVGRAVFLSLWSLPGKAFVIAFGQARKKKSHIGLKPGDLLLISWQQSSTVPKSSKSPNPIVNDLILTSSHWDISKFQ